MATGTGREAGSPVVAHCRTDRDTERAVHAAGFASVDARRIHMATVFVPLPPQIAGTVLG